MKSLANIRILPQRMQAIHLLPKQYFHLFLYTYKLFSEPLHTFYVSLRKTLCFPDGKRIAPPRETYGLRKENIKHRASFLPTYKGDYKSMIRTLMFSILMMMVTSYTGILYLSSQIGLGHLHHRTMASSDYFYATS